MTHPPGSAVARAAVLAVWAYGVWLLLTWTVTAEQLAFGAGLAVATGIALCRVVTPVSPLRVLSPRFFAGLVALSAASLGRIVRANVELAARIWAPRRPLHSGMIIVPTVAPTPTAMAASGLITSLIVDNQIADLDAERAEFQYHAISVPEGDAAQRAEAINAPTERWLGRLLRR